MGEGKPEGDGKGGVVLKNRSHLFFQVINIVVVAPVFLFQVIDIDIIFKNIDIDDVVVIIL